MGDNAEMILDGILDSETGEYIGEGVGYPRTLNESNKNYQRIKMIRKELALLIKSKTESNIHNAVEESRREINLKYGKGWRENGWG